MKPNAHKLPSNTEEWACVASNPRVVCFIQPVGLNQ